MCKKVNRNLQKLSTLPNLQKKENLNVNKLTSLKRIQMKGLLLSVVQSKLRNLTALFIM